MGAVYRAEDTTLHHTVALKFVTESVAHNPKVYERLRREACTASARLSRQRLPVKWNPVENNMSRNGNCQGVDACRKPDGAETTAEARFSGGPRPQIRQAIEIATGRGRPAPNL